MKVLTFGFNLSLLKFVYFEQKGGFNELNLRLWFILVTADKVGMNRTLNLGLLGLLPLRLCRLLGGVVVIGRLLLTNRTVHLVGERGTCWMEKQWRDTSPAYVHSCIYKPEATPTTVSLCLLMKEVLPATS